MSTSEVITSTRTVDDKEERIVRYSLTERINHWISGGTYVYCLITGLALWSPYTYWLAAVAGGGPTVRFWHPWVGVIFSASVFYMYKIWRNDMLITDADRAWWKNVRYYIRNEDEKLPPIGRFNYGQKLFFWAMFYATILLLLSGIILWIPEQVPWNLHWLRYVGVGLHVAAALISIGGMIIHVYMGTAMVRGGFTAMVRGEVSSVWARVHHRLWYEQVTKKTPPSAR
jgi:formate dehydrogenase subunit gamma